MGNVGSKLASVSLEVPGKFLLNPDVLGEVILYAFVGNVIEMLTSEGVTDIIEETWLGLL